jgi:hypothetical protein
MFLTDKKLTVLQKISYASAVGITNPIRFNTFAELFQSIITGLGVLILGLGTIMVIIAGILYLLSAGNPEKVGTAKSALFYAILGIVVGLGAQSIVATIKAAKGGATTAGELITNVTTQLGLIIAGLGTVMVIISGIFFLFSFGSPDKMALAKKSLTYAIIGIIIGLLANALVLFLKSLF